MKTYQFQYKGLLTDNLKRYFNETDAGDRLTKDTEHALIKRAQNGDVRARNKVMTSNLRFVSWTAKKFKDMSIPFEDLVQEGNIGLATAIERFDLSRGLAFRTYAYSWVKQAIMQHKASHGRTIRLPFHQSDMKRRIDKARKTFFSAKHRDASVEDLAEMLEVDVNAVKKCVDAHFDMMYADPFDNEESFEAGDEDNADNGAGYGLVSNDRKHIIHEILNKLPDVEKDIIMSLFGINDEEQEEMLSSVGERLSFTEEKIRSIKTRALKRFREYAKDSDLNEYLNL